MSAYLIHFTAYLAVNAVLAAINLTQAVPEGEVREYWFVWPLAGWGIGVAAHGLALWIERRAGQGGLMADPDARGVAVHLFVYLAVNALLIAVNVIESPGNPWALWPILGWGAGLAAHAWLAYRAITRRTVERYSTEQQILSQMQLERQASQIAAALDGKPAAPAKRRRQAGAKSSKSKTARKGSASGKTSPSKARKSKSSGGKPKS